MTADASVPALLPALGSGGHPHSPSRPSLCSCVFQMGEQTRMFRVCSVGSYKQTRPEVHRSPRRKITDSGDLKSWGPAKEGRQPHELDEDKQGMAGWQHCGKYGP